MARSQYPTWVDWSKAVEAHCVEAGKRVALPSYLINGLATNLKVQVKGLDDLQASMPYIEVRLGEVQTGHDGKETGQRAPSGRRYTAHGDDKYIEQHESWLERLIFQVDVVANRYQDVLQITQQLRRYFKPENVLTCTVNGETHSVRCATSDIGAMQLEGLGETDNAENYRVSFNVVLYTESDPDSDSKIVRSISEVPYTLSSSLG